MRHMSRTLTKAEECSQIEREEFAVTFAAKNFEECCMEVGSHYTFAIFFVQLGNVRSHDERTTALGLYVNWLRFSLKYKHMDRFPHADALFQLITKNTPNQTGGDTIIQAINVDVEIIQLTSSYTVSAA